VLKVFFCLSQLASLLSFLALSGLAERVGSSTNANPTRLSTKSKILAGVT
jgi:hypothetical protein